MITEEQIKKACEYMRVDPEGAELANEDWIISRTGDMLGCKYLYLIQDNQLTELDWMTHMVEKMWVNPYTFVQAYIKALCTAGVKELTCSVSFTKPKQTIRPFELLGNESAIAEIAGELAWSMKQRWSHDN